MSTILAKAQEDSILMRIRTNFGVWQQMIEKQTRPSAQLFHYAWGENYQEEGWYKNPLQQGVKFLFEKCIIHEKVELGTLVNYENFAMSGDWFITSDYYFDTDGKLYFVFWRMNTFQAEEDVTVEKRLYFDSEGQLIRKLKSVFKMNTREESNVSYNDHNVDYALRLREMNFYSFWKSN